MPLNTSFFNRDARTVAEELIGCHLIHETGDQVQGRIIETEAYLDTDDPASHAYKGKTSRNKVMFGPPGQSYVYVCYGIHHMFNIVTEAEGTPQAVLVRAVEPEEGLDRMKERRNATSQNELCNGPGKLCEAFEIDKRHTDLDITTGHLRVEPGSSSDVRQTTRIGISEGTELPYRFLETNNSFVSRH